ncbi:MAG: hypothetical protein D6747_07315 [Chlorobiota bacterium]|nr:MAG: hypothetical protein D6747_07315 [Chlorobiota bacterium]
MRVHKSIASALPNSREHVPRTTGASMDARLLATVSIAFATTIGLHGQTAAIRAKILAVAEGHADDVRRELPALVKEHPNDPGVLFLSAIVEPDGARAVEVYKRIVREYPASEWADDAQWRIVQYYALLRDTVHARAALADFQQRFPMSEFFIHAQDIVRTTVGLAPEAIEPQRTSERGSTSDTATQERYTLQIGAYSTKETAENEAQRFRAQRLRVEVIEKAPSLYAVTIGDYTSRAAAEKARPLVEQQCNCTPFIIPKPHVVKQSPKRGTK